MTPAENPDPQAAERSRTSPPGRTALVTGGSRGIGRAVAEDLSRDHHVIVGATTREAAEEVARGLPSAEVFVADLSDPEAIRREVARLTGGTDGSGGGAPLESLDVLVHSAGIAPNKTVEEADWDDWEGIFRVNVFAVAELTRLLLPALRTARGTVVAVNSGSGYTSFEEQALYSGSKFALRALTDALREEERGTVRVSSVHPGKVDTDMQVAIQEHRGNTDYDGSVYVRPESVARAVRLAVDTTDEAMVDEVHVRPVRK